ncbi:polymer-forming cytoskeletal protein [bacterium AH-315-I18]|nr:polymer-forming cytoskeletal protein [Phycisphaeraceae bacterium]MBN4060884.1 polymer-forming cytoskeletal protein [bacterium AH-315-I18]
MPLKPSMLTTRPRKPVPREVRTLSCPNCGETLEVSRRAMSYRCGKCSMPMKLEDVTVKHVNNGTLSTMGHVHLTAHSKVDGELICGELTVSGSYNGNAHVHGLVKFQAKSHSSGDIHARSLTIEKGASFQGRLSIGPNAQIQAPILDPIIDPAA